MKQFPMSEVVTACGPMIARRGFDSVMDIYEHMFGERVQKIEFIISTPERGREILALSERAITVLRTTIPDVPLILDFHVPAAQKDWDLLSGNARRRSVFAFADALDERFEPVSVPRQF